MSYADVVTDMRPYHHGDLHRVLLNAAVGTIEEHGIAALSMRGVARRAGVSHAAPTHHFGDKAGLLTAIAIQGYQLLNAALTTAAQTIDRAELAVAYVQFAADHPAHFVVMSRPELLHSEDTELVAGRELTRNVFRCGAADAASAAVAWSVGHGLATLLCQGIILPEPGTGVSDLARVVAARLRLDC